MAVKEKKLSDEHRSRIEENTALNEGIIGEWILELFRKVAVERKEALKAHRTLPIKHLFVDLEAVKADTMYELFFIRKEDGSRFFNPKLIRSMKLACEFGEQLTSRHFNYPLERLTKWRDSVFRCAAGDLLRAVQKEITAFYQKAREGWEQEVVHCMNQALMALKLASNPHYSYHDVNVKSCKDYFHDFQLFFRQVLDSSSYQKLAADSDLPQSSLNQALKRLVQAICYAYFMQVRGYQEVLPEIQRLIEDIQGKEEKPKEKKISLSDVVRKEQAALSKFMKQYPSGPLSMTLALLDEDPSMPFDPLLQGNIPNQLFWVRVGERKVWALHCPSPTVHVAMGKSPKISEEFRGFLHALRDKGEGQHHLIINMQDRTSWREEERSRVLEELQQKPEFSNQLNVVTLAMDGDFYFQQGAYAKENHVAQFLHSFREQLLLDSGGYFFPAGMKEVLNSTFIDQTFAAIHTQFFGGKNVLSHDKRLEFIEIFHLVLELKVIALSEATSFSLSCKDGADVAAPAYAQFYCFIRLMSEGKLSKEELPMLAMLLHTPALLARERTVEEERVQRMIKICRLLEGSPTPLRNVQQ